MGPDCSIFFLQNHNAYTMYIIKPLFSQALNFLEFRICLSIAKYSVLQDHLHTRSDTNGANTNNLEIHDLCHLKCVLNV